MTRDSIEYTGIAENIRSVDLFRQVVADGKFCLPVEQPDIEQIINVEVKSEVTRVELIGTPEGTSAEGYRLSGRSIVVQGLINVRIQYVGALPKQPVISASFVLPFLTTLVVPACTQPYEISAASYVEDISVTEIDQRCIYVRAALYIAAKDCTRRCLC